MAKASSKGTGGKFPMGGNTKMFGKQSAGPRTPGTTASKSGSGSKFAAGGNTKMFGKGSASPRAPGRTARDSQ